MADRDVKKNERVHYTKELKRKRNELTVKLTTLKEGTDEFNNCRKAIEDIDKILNEKSNVMWNGLKVGGMLLLTVVGLGLAHKDDIGDTIPGKAVSGFVDKVLFRKL